MKPFSKKSPESLQNDGLYTEDIVTYEYFTTFCKSANLGTMIQTIIL